MKSELTPLLVFAIAVAVTTSILAVGSTSTTSDNLSIVVGHGTTIIEDNKVTTPELVVDNITPKTDNVRIENLTVGSIPSHDAAQHTNVTRELFIPVLDDIDVNATLAQYGPYLVVECADGVTTLVMFTFKVPDDFVSFGSIKVVWATPIPFGNMVWKLNAYHGAAGELYGIHSDLPGLGATATEGDDLITVQEPANPLTMTSLVKGDYVGIEFTRAGGDANDTLDQVARLFGLLFTYVAEQ